MATKKTSEKSAAKSAGPSIIKKLSVATVYGPIKIKDIPDGQELMLVRFAGIASATSAGESTYGQWRCLVGECAATNLATGEVFVGRNAFVPGAFGEALIDGLISAQREDAGASIKFCVDVSAKVSGRDSNKYEYVVRPVIESDVKNLALDLLTAG